MTFSLKDFLKKGFLSAIGKMADYQIIINAAGWYDKGVLDDNDLAEIQVAIDAQYIIEETEMIEELEGEIVETDIIENVTE